MHVLESYNFTPILGWSVSRYETFTNCKRQYYYTYYGKYDNQIPYETILYFKQLTSLPLEKGNITHDLIRDILRRFQKTSADIDTTKFQSYIFNMTKRYCANKEFAEIVFNKQSTINIQELYEEIKGFVIAFLNSKRFSWIKEHLNEGTEDWIIEPAGFGETRFNDLKAYCKVDFLIPIDDKYYIFDWKTGRLSPDKHRKQMLAYSAWTQKFFNVDSKKIHAILAFLNPDYVEVGEHFTNDELEDFNQQLKLETEEMYTYCSNIKDNVPIRKEEFTKTSNYHICSFCNFRRLCNREKI